MMPRQCVNLYQYQRLDIFMDIVGGLQSQAKKRGGVRKGRAAVPLAMHE